MKVLFAVNSESISEAIIKKYQKDYREILSYKNVYYFNAIIKEIQKDKSYDRIIISEDLEPFSNNNYESIDKFVFEKLDSISDEAHDSEGNEISIILISSDRHTKGSSFLVKIFGIGVYNALLGNDRSMEEVCRLIHKPRTKKEAKMYYKIDTDDVNYRAENENEVSELEIQNILSHFKKLGKNASRYAGSFENIASQYTEEQLKIIINCLPITVKSVLEQTSQKYQEVMSINGGLIKGIKNSNFEIQQDQKRTGVTIDIIENKKQVAPPGSIVIPNSVKSSGAVTKKKVVTQKPVQEEKPQVKVTQSNIAREAQLKNAQEDTLNSVRVKVPQKQEVREIEQVPKKVTQIDDILEEAQLKETQIQSHQSQLEVLDEQMVKTVKPEPKRRGRPRKNPIDDNVLVEKPKGKRGRPRKNPIEEVEKLDDFQELKTLEKDELPDLDTITEQQLDLEVNNNSNKELDDMMDFGDLMDLPDEKTSLEELNEKPIENVNDEEIEDVELPELDDLEDLDTSNVISDDDNFLDITEEAFDEFDDYDEYGEYTTKAKTKEPIEELYNEDILETDEFSDIDEIDELDDIQDISDSDSFDLDELSDFEDIEDITEHDDEGVLEEPIKEMENTTQIEDEFDSFDMGSIDILDDISESVEEDVSDEDNKLLLDFDDNADLLSEIDNIDQDIETPKNEEFNFEDNIEISEENGPINDTNFGYGNQNLENIKSPIDYSMSNLNSLMTKDKKIVTFLGSTKNGVSFLVNNLAEIFASLGIDTAILDMTKNKNSYYIYTQNEEALRKIAYSSLDKLQTGIAEGISVKQNLTVYTSLPSSDKNYSSAEPILSTLVQNHSLVLIDCDFDTDPSYFASCQEIYLVQSMDILTIQPLTAFLRDLKTQGVLEPEKVRVVINKELKVRGLTNKAIIGGMAFYNDPAMSFMTELFNKDVVTYCSIPFDENVYASYLEGMLNCRVSLSGYSKNFKNKLKVLGDMVYPLTSRKTFSNTMNQGYIPNQNGFSSNMNNTLNKMKKNY